MTICLNPDKRLWWYFLAAVWLWSQAYPGMVRGRRILFQRVSEIYYIHMEIERHNRVKSIIRDDEWYEKIGF